MRDIFFFFFFLIEDFDFFFFFLLCPLTLVRQRLVILIRAESFFSFFISWLELLKDLLKRILDFLHSARSNQIQMQYVSTNHGGPTVKNSIQGELAIADDS